MNLANIPSIKDVPPLIGITIGDEEGIGPEIAIKTILHPDIRGLGRIVIIGNPDVLERAKRLLSVDYRLPILNEIDDLKRFEGEYCIFYREKKGIVNEIDYIDTAIQLAIERVIVGFATCPVSKGKISSKLMNFTGHTEYLIEKTHTRRALMTFFGTRFGVGLISTHIPFKYVPSHLSVSRVMEGVLLADHYLKFLFEGRSNVIGLCGLNPHAGEGGLLGEEENDILIPAVKILKERGVNITNPIPADTCFRLAMEGRISFVIALYHDQGLIPLRMIDFGRAVHVTLGLPFLRVSPDHGVAYDISWKGIAIPDSLVKGVRFLFSHFRAYDMATKSLSTLLFDLSLKEECYEKGVDDK